MLHVPIHRPYLWAHVTCARGTCQPLWTHATCVRCHGRTHVKCVRRVPWGHVTCVHRG